MAQKLASTNTLADSKGASGSLVPVEAHVPQAGNDVENPVWIISPKLRIILWYD
jgi:hypothetical protein